MDIPSVAPTLKRLQSHLAWFSLSKLPTTIVTRLFSLIVGIAILSMANTAMAAMLRQGSSGSSVRDLQNRLTSVQCYDGPITGYFGPLTQSAVKFCQQQYGITVDGIVGPETMATLSGQPAQRVTAQRVKTKPASSRRIASTVATSQSLQRGSRGQAVIELQRQLQALGFYQSTIDGDFGPLTEQAVASLQRQNGLSQTGVFSNRERQILTRSSQPQPVATAAPLAGTIGRQQLTVGDAGKDVQKLQAKLKDLRYFDSAATGYYGKLTKLAVQNFQTARQLPSTGIADQQTLQALGISQGSQQATAQTTTAQATPFKQGSFITRNDAIVPTDNLGQAEITQGGRFVVIVPKRTGSELSMVKQLVPDAIEGTSSIGPYIQAGAFSNQTAADAKTRELKAYGLDARVAYR